MANPYEPPKAPVAPNVPVALISGDQCPQCQSNNVRKPGFTWWGGAIGPRIFNHRICNACGFGYNAKTGKSNTTAIIIYQAVLLAIGALIVIAQMK
jgi:hypothetical protein